MKILLAEDDTNISKITKITLEKMGGHTVYVEADGKKALEMALCENYDLILLDNMMPNMDGLSVCRELKKSNKSHIPIIFLSAKNQESDIKESLLAGATGYIPKPFNPIELQDKIVEILSLKEASSE